MKFNLRHQTEYTYINSVDNYQSVVCMQPISNDFQSCSSFELKITPEPNIVFSRTDYFGNIQHFFSIHESHYILKVEAISKVLISPKVNIEKSNISCEDALSKITNERELKIQLLQFQLPSQYVTWDEEINAFAASCFSPDKPLYDAVLALVEKIYKEFEFKSGFSNINTPLKTILKEKKGVCQDFSHLAISCIRSMGFAAKYVSGYIETLPPKGKPKLQGSDASHAWISVFIPNMGWCEFDPTNNLIPSDKHIVVAYGRDYADVAPMKGIVFSSGSHKVKVEVDVISKK